MAVHAYHPETGADAVLTEEQLAHLRIAGWVARAEHDEQEAARAAAEAESAPAPKTAKEK